MSGGALTKEAKEMFLKEDIEHKRQRTLDNKNFIPKEICKCGYTKKQHEEGICYNSKLGIDCKGFTPKEIEEVKE